MNNIAIRKATIDDLIIIQELNNGLFELEKENYDSTLTRNQPLTDEGKEYFTDLINNSYVIAAELDNNIVQLIFMLTGNKKNQSNLVLFLAKIL